MWISISTGASVFLFVLAIFGGSSRKLGRQAREEWLFSNFFERIYEAIYREADPKEKAAKLGMDYEKYIRNCRILRVEPNWRKEAGMRMVGISLFAATVLFSFFLQTVVFAILGMIPFFCLGPYQERQIAHQAKQRRHKLTQDLPRFIDLFSTALEVGVPVESAIKITAQEIPCVVSEELLLAMAETELGAKSWQ